MNERRHNGSIRDEGERMGRNGGKRKGKEGKGNKKRRPGMNRRGEEGGSRKEGKGASAIFYLYVPHTSPDGTKLQG